ncbi:MAG: hypothetical protein IJU62_07020 [Muribaculaceae bacterium]|nr:hypothetical protein [Muribaculaceae bacterium]
MKKNYFSFLLLALAALVSFSANADCWIIGELSNGWVTNDGLKMDQGSSENEYVADITNVEMGKKYFSFTTQLSEAADDWSGIQPYRFGGSYNITSGKPQRLDANTGDSPSVTLSTTSDLHIVFNTSSRMVIITITEKGEVEPFDPDKLTFYITGGDFDWSMPPAVMFEKNDDGTHRVQITSNGGEFKLCGTTVQQADLNWGLFDMGVYGTAEALVEGDNTLTAGTTNNMTMPLTGNLILTVKDVTETSCVLNIAVDGDNPGPEPKEADGVYVLGNIEGNPNGFQPCDGIALSSNDEVVYTGSIHVVDSWEGKGWIGLTRALADFDGDNGGWTQINSLRFGPTAAEGVENYVIDDTQLDVAIPVTYDSHMSFEMAEGYYNISVDLNAMTVTFTAGEEPEPELYLLGDIEGNDGWAANAGVAMDLVSGKKFSKAVTVKDSYNGNGWFSFTTALGSDWDAIAGSRYGAAEVKDSESDYVMAEGDYGTELAIAKGQIAFCALAGDYTITVDLDALTCVIEKAGDGNKFDVNGDNKVDVGDVNAILEAILAGNNEAKFNVNGDTSVDVGDVNAVLEAILAQ